MSSLESKVGGIESKFVSLESKVGGIIESKFVGLESKFGGLESKFDGLESKVGGLESKFDAFGGELRQVTEGQKRLIATVSGLTEMSVRQSVGNPVPDEYQAALIGSLPSLLAELAYLRSSSCPIASLLWPRTKTEVEERVLNELKNPVGLSRWDLIFSL